MCPMPLMAAGIAARAEAVRRAPEWKGAASRVMGPVGEIEPRSRAEWRRWLAGHHGTSAGIWLIFHKKRAGAAQPLTLDEAVREALCFGWIDSTLRPLDDDKSALLFTPRRPGGTWSRSNKQRAESLIAAGLMTAAGQNVIEAAKRDGSWNSLDAIEELRVPGDLEQALAADPAAKRNFDAFTSSAKKEVLWWIESARRPQTRANRIAETVRLAAEGATVSSRPRQQASRPAGSEGRPAGRLRAESASAGGEGD